MSSKRHSSDEIIAKPTSADRLVAEGTGTDAICHDLGVSEATHHRWRAQVGWLKAEEAKRLRLLEYENASLRRQLAAAELMASALNKVAQGKILSPERRYAAVNHLQQVLGVSERFACSVSGQSRTSHRRFSSGNAVDNTDDLRNWLHRYSEANPRCGVRRAFQAALEDGWSVSRRKFTRLWQEERLQARPGRPRKCD